MGPGLSRAFGAAWAAFCAAAAMSCGVEARHGDAVTRITPEAPAFATPSEGDDAKPRESVSMIDDAPREQAEPSLPPMPKRAERLVDGALRVDLYPPLDAELERAPLVAYLHGAGGNPSDCAWIQQAGRGKSFLACPAGNAQAGDGFTWFGPTRDRIATVEAALAAVDATLGARVDHRRGDVLVGFSRGAYLARDLLADHPGMFRGVIYIGAEIKPDAAGLRAAGVRRVVLASGDFDGAAKQMRRTAATLDAQGIPARFMSFGKMGHGWPDDIDAILTRAIDWIREDPTFGS